MTALDDVSSRRRAIVSLLELVAFARGKLGFSEWIAGKDELAEGGQAAAAAGEGLNIAHLLERVVLETKIPDAGKIM